MGLPTLEAGIVSALKIKILTLICCGKIDWIQPKSLLNEHFVGSIQEENMNGYSARVTGQIQRTKMIEAKVCPAFLEVLYITLEHNCGL